MYPEDRVLVAYVPSPTDFAVVRDEQWYRLPARYAPKGLFAEYFAFYFGGQFGPEKWAVHYYARRHGHELSKRIDLLPQEPEHPRAQELYYKVQLGPLQQLQRPIVSMRWRRITFIHTTWDRFQDAVEINDLFVDGGEYVDRLYATLRERGLHPERNYTVRERTLSYEVPLAVLCREGRVEVQSDEIPKTEAELTNLANKITRSVIARGGEARSP